MKTLSIFLFIAFFSFMGYSQQIGDTIISNNPAKLKAKILYFHITNRCHTCYSIETNVRKTIDEFFKNELDSGIVELYIINCELPENKAISEKYQAYGATLAVTKVGNGKEITEDLTQFAFSKIHNEDLFVSELKQKIDELIK